MVFAPSVYRNQEEDERPSSQPLFSPSKAPGLQDGFSARCAKRPGPSRSAEAPSLGVFTALSSSALHSVRICLQMKGLDRASDSEFSHVFRVATWGAGNSRGDEKGSFETTETTHAKND